MRVPFSLASVPILLLLLQSSAGCINSAPNAVEDLITNHRYPKLLVEIDYADGHTPRSSATDLLKTRIQGTLQKPGGTTFEEKAFTPSKSSYTDDDLLAVESQKRNHQPGGDTMVLYILYLNGHHARDTSNEKILGVHYGRASIAIFKETIDSSGGVIGSLFSANDVERSVLVHEFGHTIGLVNNGLKMVKNHEDPQHRAHSTNKESVMYWAVDTTLGLAGLTGSIPNEFDSDDLADVRNGGGK